MKVTYDPQAKALYIYTGNKGIVDGTVYGVDIDISNYEPSQELHINAIDVDEFGEVLGYEILNVELETLDKENRSIKILPEDETLNRLAQQHVPRDEE